MEKLYYKGIYFSEQTWSKWIKNEKLNDLTHYPVNIYFFKVNNRNTRKWCKRCSKLTIKTPEHDLERENISWVMTNAPIIWKPVNWFAANRLDGFYMVGTLIVNPFQPSVAFHVETSHLFSTANQMTGFYMKSSTDL